MEKNLPFSDKILVVKEILDDEIKCMYIHRTIDFWIFVIKHSSVHSPPHTHTHNEVLGMVLTIEVHSLITVDFSLAKNCELCERAVLCVTLDSVCQKEL
jgi:hypothetical protein